MALQQGCKSWLAVAEATKRNELLGHRLQKYRLLCRGYEREAVFTKVKGKVFQLRGGFVLARFGGEQDNIIGEPPEVTEHN